MKHVALLIAVVTLCQTTDAACFDPVVEAGFAYKDQTTESLVVTQLAAPARGAKVGDTIVGIGVKGLYYGCRIPQANIAVKSARAKKFNLFLPLRGASVQGFELDVSSESRRVLSGRPIQVPWSVVDRTTGVTAACAESTPTAFESFLYGALRGANARRCTQVEIETIVGPTRVRARPVHPAPAKTGAAKAPQPTRP
jgi:hypothetical protein